MAKKTIIYIFGNPLLDFDNLPIKLAPKLKKQFPQIDFIIMDPNENIKPINKELIIIDTVAEIDKVIVFNDLDKLILDNIYSAHDFDLAFNLKLLQKINKLKKATIFGVPFQISEIETLRQLTKLIKKTLKPTKPN